MVILSEEYLDFVLDIVNKYPASAEYHILKIQEEVGEAAEALILNRKMNPRKLDQDVSTYDVALELGDVVMTALVAIAGLGYDPNDMLADQQSKTRKQLPL